VFMCCTVPSHICRSVKQHHMRGRGRLTSLACLQCTDCSCIPRSCSQGPWSGGVAYDSWWTLRGWKEGVMVSGGVDMQVVFASSPQISVVALHASFLAGRDCCQ